MAGHPYRSFPPESFWARSIAGRDYAEVDPVVSAKFTVGRADRIVTAGSCFAQHISRALSARGFTHFVTESAPPNTPAELAAKYGYGVFSARYGNIYTPRQLVQLFQRAYGQFSPAEEVWQGEDGRFIDPFRPGIQPRGFASLAEYEACRMRTFLAVRQAVETLDVFVFTLGLTEAWVSRVDGAVFPVCPGVMGGVFDPAKYVFHNFGVSEVIADVRYAIDFIRARNPRTKFILTVSPVPLIATAEQRSVLVSTTYSKSVLRVAAQDVATADPDVAYFPSYEVISGSFNRGRYFAEDLHSVTEAGVEHVMRLFLRHYCGEVEIDSTALESPAEKPAAEYQPDRMDRAAAVICEEEALGRR